MTIKVNTFNGIYNMGKNKRIQFQILDTRTNEIVSVDSQEEVLTYKWLLYALKCGIIKDFKYQPISFQLSEPVKYKVGKKEKCLFREHIYSPDILVEVNPKYENLLNEFKVTFDNKIYIDIKGTFNKTGRSFSIDQKWVYQKYGYYIYKLIPKDFFKKFGILEEFLYTQKTHKPSKVFQGYPIFNDIFEVNNSNDKE